ncbi:hypothetical protein NE237_016068 [Protea cynaroides]|uniref:Uncharacterized protein n=1 Tax=Protea cynaroides TaxID=273540 RepID=A0A9Q0KF66_9MAGN|nr:hypothetical protein NE237_016068 [Protea cynaroides]
MRREGYLSKVDGTSSATHTCAEISDKHADEQLDITCAEDQAGL